MRLGQAIFTAAVFVVCAVAGAKAAPPAATLSGAALQSRIDAEPVRWRHRHRGDYFWSDGRADVGSREDANPLTIFGATRSSVPEILRPDARRRRSGWVNPPPE
jgi:hypothetical protein